MPCVFAMHLPKFMEARILLQSKEATELVFPPLIILLRKEETRKGKVEQGRLLCFCTMGSAVEDEMLEEGESLNPRRMGDFLLSGFTYGRWNLGEKLRQKVGFSTSGIHL